jgi:20S proteasome alpha/beta subunit
MAYNGAAIIAMVGKDCVAIAADRRLGVQGQTVACDFQKVFPMGEKLMIGLAGLATDVQTLYVGTTCWQAMAVAPSTHDSGCGAKRGVLY